MTAPGTIAEALDGAARGLAEAGIGKPRMEARLLAGHALRVDPAVVLGHPERALTRIERTRLAILVRRRARREPIAQLFGEREFWSLKFKVTADVLTPRPDSETVVEAALAGVPDRGAPLRLLDLGTGTGCLLLALLSELEGAQGLGVDISPAAVEVARANAAALGFADRATFRTGDWGRGIRGPFDLIVANPPYIPSSAVESLEPEVARFEPRRALSGGVDGLDCYRRLVPDVARLLKPGATAVVEVGAGQAARVSAILAGHGLHPVAIQADLSGIERCLIATPHVD